LPGDEQWHPAASSLPALSVRERKQEAADAAAAGSDAAAAATGDAVAAGAAVGRVRLADLVDKLAAGRSWRTWSDAGCMKNGLLQCQRQLPLLVLMERPLPRGDP